MISYNPHTANPGTNMIVTLCTGDHNYVTQFPENYLTNTDTTTPADTTISAGVSCKQYLDKTTSGNRMFLI